MLKKSNLFCFAIIVIGLVSIKLAGEEPAAPSGGTEKADSSKSTYTDSIAASVNGEIITHSEVEFYTRQFHRDERSVLQLLIKKKLVLQTAKKENVTISDEEVDKRLEPIVKAEGGKEEFEKKLRAILNVPYEKYRQDLREEMMREKYIRNKVNWQMAAQESKDKEAKPSYVIDTYVSPKEIRDYFEEHKAFFTGGSKIKVQQIVLVFDNEVTQNSKRTLAEALLNEIKDGANFAQLAARFSSVNADTGGVSDYAPKEDFPAQVSDVIFKLKTDELSPVIETEKDYRIVRVLDKIEAVQNIDSPELQQRIKKVLYDKKLQDGLSKLGDDLVKTADVWVDPEMHFSWDYTPDTISTPASQK